MNIALQHKFTGYIYGFTFGIVNHAGKHVDDHSTAVTLENCESRCLFDWVAKVVLRAVDAAFK